MHPVPLKPETCFKLYWAHIRVTYHQPRMSGDSGSLEHCFQQGFIPRGPTFRVPEVCRKHSHTSPHIYPSLGNSTLIAWVGATALSLSPTTDPKLLTTAMKTPPDVCLRSSLFGLSPVILAASAAILDPSFASLLNCSSISSFLSLCSIPKKISHFPLYLLMYFLSMLIHTMCTSIIFLLSACSLYPTTMSSVYFSYTSLSSSSFSSSFTSTILLSSIPEFATFLLYDLFLEKLLGSFPGCFLQRFLGPYPGCLSQMYLGPHPGYFLQRSLGPYPGCFCFFFLASHNFFSILPHGSPSFPISSFSLSLLFLEGIGSCHERVPRFSVCWDFLTQSFRHLSQTQHPHTTHWPCSHHPNLLPKLPSLLLLPPALEHLNVCTACGYWTCLSKGKELLQHRWIPTPSV